MSAVLYQLSYITVLRGGDIEIRTQVSSMPCLRRTQLDHIPKTMVLKIYNGSILAPT